MDSSTNTQGKDCDIFPACNSNIFNTYAILKTLCNARARMNIAPTTAFAFSDNVLYSLLSFFTQLRTKRSPCKIAQQSIEMVTIMCNCENTCLSPWVRICKR